MTTKCLRTMAAAGAVLLAMATGATAGDNALLSTIEVQQLVASGQPADHARLRDHFVALADQYATDARRDINVARTLGAGSTRRAGSGAGAKFIWLAEAANKSAAIVHELADHHGRLAVGLESAAPKDGARFDAGEGATVPTPALLERLAARARTPADHGLLAEYYLTVVASSTKAAEEHVTMGRMYRTTAARVGNAAVHCDRMIKVYREAADAARKAAGEHSEHLASVG